VEQRREGQRGSLGRGRTEQAVGGVPGHIVVGEHRALGPPGVPEVYMIRQGSPRPTGSRGARVRGGQQLLVGQHPVPPSLGGSAATQDRTPGARRAVRRGALRGPAVHDDRCTGVGEQPLASGRASRALSGTQIARVAAGVERLERRGWLPLIQATRSPVLTPRSARAPAARRPRSANSACDSVSLEPDRVPLRVSSAGVVRARAQPGITHRRVERGAGAAVTAKPPELLADGLPGGANRIARRSVVGRDGRSNARAI